MKSILSVAPTRTCSYPSLDARDPLSDRDNFSSAEIRGALAPSLVNSEASSRRTSTSTSSICGVAGRDHQLHRSTFLFYKVLRFLQAGHCIPPRLIRINRQLRIMSYLAVKGGVLIRGLNLVAWPAGSERRNHPLHHVVIQPN
jgi:hypothetical protein